MGVSWVYFRWFGFAGTLQTATAFMAIVIFLDIFFVAMLIEGSFAMFASVTGTWLPFLLIFMATHLTGRVMGRTAPSWCLRPGAKIAPGCP